MSLLRWLRATEQSLSSAALRLERVVFKVYELRDASTL